MSRSDATWREDCGIDRLTLSYAMSGCPAHLLYNLSSKIGHEKNRDPFAGKECMRTKNITNAVSSVKRNN